MVIRTMHTEWLSFSVLCYSLCFLWIAENTRIVQRNLDMKNKDNIHFAADKVDVLVPDIIQVWIRFHLNCGRPV